MTGFVIRPARAGDLAALQGVADAMGDRHEPNYFERCLQEQEEGKRAILVCEGETDAVALSGYAQLNWQPLYAPFRRLSIPEIQDLNVIPSSRRQGLGEKLVRACEILAQAKSDTIGISVGMQAKFGPAQRLYVRLGYLPDGAGVCYDDVPCALGDGRLIDDLLTLKLIKAF